MSEGLPTLLMDVNPTFTFGMRKEKILHTTAVPIPGIPMKEQIIFAGLFMDGGSNPLATKGVHTTIVES